MCECEGRGGDEQEDHTSDSTSLFQWVYQSSHVTVHFQVWHFGWYLQLDQFVVQETVEQFKEVVLEEKTAMNGYDGVNEPVNYYIEQFNCS